MNAISTFDRQAMPEAGTTIVSVCSRGSIYFFDSSVLERANRNGACEERKRCFWRQNKYICKRIKEADGEMENEMDNYAFWLCLYSLQAKE
jgi:hypothetical protein